MKTTLTALLAASAIGMVALPANAQSASAHAGHSMSQSAPATVVDVAIGSPDHTTLVQAVTAADLAGTLQGTGPFTVFAPTNAAFAALPAGTVENLLKPENKDQLVAILTMHVLPRVLMSTQLLAKPFHVKTLNADERLTISAKSSGVTVSGSNTAKVVQADVKADNGVIHVIDTVLLP